MALTLNQFGITDIKGRVVNPDKGFRYDVQNGGSSALVVGDCVKIKHVAGSKTIQVEKIAAVTDKIFGVVQYESAGKQEYEAGEMLTVAGHMSIITCEANAAINAGVDVEAVIAGQKVKTLATTNAVPVGTALTPAAIAGDLILVRVA